MVYKFGFCPNCGKKISLQNHIVGGVYADYIDLPYKKCPYCQKEYATGKKFYSEMNEEERKKVDGLVIKDAFNSAGVYIVIFVAIFGFICMVLSWINLELPKGVMITIVFIICIFSFIKGYKSAKKVLDQIKNMTSKDL